MMSIFRKLTSRMRGGHKEAQLREELQFHLAEEADEQQANGVPPDEARRDAYRDLGNVTRVIEETRTVWTWTLVEQLAQDVKYAFRTMAKNRMFTALAALSLALGIGANTAIYSFIDSILLRALPVEDPGSLVVIKWRSKPIVRDAPGGSQFVLHSIDGSTYKDSGGVTASIFPMPAFERLQQSSPSVFSSLFAYKSAGNLTVMVNGESQLAAGEYVSGDFFRGLGTLPAAGRLIVTDDDRVGAPPVAIISMGYCRRRFGTPSEADGQPVLINNVPFTVVGVTGSGFFGVDPGAAPDVYLPLHSNVLLDKSAANDNLDANYYWLEMMGRLSPGVRIDQAQAVLAGPFAQWVATTATDRERANLPMLRLENGGGGLETLKRKYTKPLYVLLTIVGLILAIACANTANLLLARATARKREMAVRLSIGASRWRLVRQLLTESVLLASLGGALGILVAMWGMRVLTRLLANGQEGFTLHAEVNWHVLAVTLGLSVLCGMLFGLVPALQSTRPALAPSLNERTATESAARVTRGMPRLRLTQVLVVAQIGLSLLLLVAAGLFVRTLSNLNSIPLGFDRDRVLLFDLNPLQAGYPELRAAAFYVDVQERLRTIAGVSGVTLSHASLFKAGRSHTMTVNGIPVTTDTRILLAGPDFFTTMKIPILRGRGFDDRERQGAHPVAVINDLFARTWFRDENPIGRQIRVFARRNTPVDLEIVGVAATARYGGLKGQIPPVVYVSYAQFAYIQQMTFALRTTGDPLHTVADVRRVVQGVDAHVPVINIRTQSAEIDQTINQEIVFARLCSAFAILALVIACVGLYATMAYMVARRTSEIGIRLALGAPRGVVVWMIMRQVCLLAVVGLAIGVPLAMGTSRLIASFLFAMEPNDARALAGAVAILMTAALVAGYGPARRASRVDPIVALRHE